MTDLLPARTYLFVPGTRPERFAKALASGADAVVLDLEDAVAPDDKAQARRRLRVAAVPEADRAPCRGADQRRGLRLVPRRPLRLAEARPRRSCCPKPRGPAQIAATLPPCAARSARADRKRTRRGAVDAWPRRRVSRLVFGTLDFALDLDMDISTDAAGLAYAASRIAIASRVARLAPPVAGVTPQLDDEARCWPT